MPQVPDTRASLIVSLPCAEDAAAWREFVGIYEPFVYRFARRNGLQDADAAELVQNVLMSVVKAVGRWEAEPKRARFRSWLFTIARNQLIDMLARRNRIRSGSSSVIDLLSQQKASGDLTAKFVLDHRRELFRWAASQVKKAVTAPTWQAFWLTSVEEKTVEEAAAALKMTPGAVYIARSRVLAKLRAEVRALEADHAL